MSRLWPIVVLAIAPGCLSLPGDRPLPVQVVDAETKQPIRTANVQIVYPFAPLPWDARGSTGTCAGDGIARLRVSASDDPAITLEVTALGYMTEEKPLPAEAVKALEPPHFLENTDHRSPAVVVELYADPRPTVELMLPAGFRGRVRATVLVRDDACHCRASGSSPSRFRRPERWKSRDHRFCTASSLPISTFNTSTAAR